LPDLEVGSGLTFTNSSGSPTSGTGTRVAASFTYGLFKVYQFTAGTGNVKI
jgi:hypothetical protein